MTISITIPEKLKNVEVTSCASVPGDVYKTVPLTTGRIRINRHTHKYLLGDTLFDLGKIVLSVKEVVEPKVHVHMIGEIPEGLNMLQGEVMSEKDFVNVHFYVSEKIADWAFKALQTGKTTIQTLSPSFAGRDAVEMKEFLIKNYVHKR